ncbi:MAG: response regulator transcription factor [Anaerolineae bacterium]|jgi:DNA-binding NarL/FixJ family response regulator|uniref:response regulator transcription factor n=1 Tax=Candidatus Flexifilum breve TaxID=3140694 RepID=UPI001AC73FFC|nr:response regulator transcription factor [Chloroflexota bacterium]MBK9750677.1 response regulator transcription factor [Chloroflexota bacterium]MBN8635051.1 response regulator transcription factor [Anaerolineae bacterium]
MIDRRERRAPQIISVLIVDDHPLFREGLQIALNSEDDITVIGQCADGQVALQQAQQLRPDVVLLDVNLPSINGLQVARQLKAEAPHIAVVMLTAYHDSEQVLHTMRAGASAYCPKDITPDDLIEVIHAAAAGYYIIGNQRMDADQLTTWINTRMETLNAPYIIDPDEHYIPLSPREMEILEFVTNGLSNKEIANRLKISQQTVKNHMTSILKKLNVQDRTQAAVHALRNGWVRIHGEGQKSTSAKG